MGKLKPCPFCGTEPTVIRYGTERTKRRSIVIKCPKCRIAREDGAVRFGFDWLEGIASKQWNERVEPVRAG